jgi:cbb3-type cytochrome oxidase subunit 1
MDWFVKAFLKTSISWLGLGVTLGLAMVIHPPWTAYRTAHIHMNLLGFVSMMIFGVAYHVIPRFTSHPLHSRRLAGAHWWAANLGLALLAAGFATLAGPRTLRLVLLATGGSMSAMGAYAFIYNIWRTIDGPRVSVQTPGTIEPHARRLPLSGATAR